MTTAVGINVNPVVPPIKNSFLKLDCILFVFAAITTICLAILFITGGVYATEIRALTDLFETRTFRGSTDALQNFEFMGRIMHYVISAFSFIGLCLVIYQRFITLLYLSSRNLFDTVYDIKTTRMKGAALGYAGLFNDLFVRGENSSGGSGGGGLDVLITFGYSLLPNVRAYCDYAPEAVSKNKLDENDNVTQYMLKTAIPTIMLIFFLTIGFSGTLMRAYGVVVDGMAAAADHLVRQNLTTWVQRSLGGMGGHSFTLNSPGTEASMYAQRVAEDMYSRILGMMTGPVNEVFADSLGIVISDSVFGAGVHRVMPVSSPDGADSVLGGSFDFESNASVIGALVRANLPAAAHESFPIHSDQSFRALRTPLVFVSQSQENLGGRALVWNVEQLLERALNDDPELAARLVRPVNPRFIHVITSVDINVRTSYLVPDLEEMTRWE